VFGCDHGEAATRLGSYKVPEALSIVDEFPRNALSKLDRNRLLAMVPDVGKVGGARS
jgi:non-ribosomal peptide synthetase component E (peptide arylation enzyme)